MRCGKVFCPDRHFLVGPHLNVANPIGIWSKTIRHDDLGTILPVLDNLQYSLAPKTRTATCMSQQQQAFPK